MGAAVAVPLVVAAIGAGTALYVQHRQEQAAADAKKNLPTPPVQPVFADQAPLDAQAARRRRLAAGASSTILTSPQGLGGTGTTPTAPGRSAVLGA